MASCKSVIPDDLMRQLREMENIDKVAPKMLNAAKKVVKPVLKKNISRHRRTGDLEKSIKGDKNRKNQYGWYTKLFFDGYDRNGVPNNLKANVIENGRSNGNRGNIPAQPFLQKTVNESNDDVVDAMQEVYNEEYGL